MSLLNAHNIFTTSASGHTKIRTDLTRLTKEQLKAKAWKHTKWNMALALLTGALSGVIGKTITNKFLMPINEKMFDIAEKQKKVRQKAKELVEIENQKEQEVKNTEENKSEKTDN